MAKRVLIVGGSFGGLRTAYALRKQLEPREVEVTLISKEPRFTFIPSLPWVAMGRRRLQDISFDLAPVLARRQIRFAHETATGFELERHLVRTDAREHEYDFLLIATGHRSANEAVPGLGPFAGPGHCLMSPPEAEELRSALERFLQRPGPMVVGCAPGASCIGPAYEFALEVDHLLRRRGSRSRVPITFVTPEPYLGHMGMGGAGKIRQFLEGEFEERDIRYRTSTAITEITAEAVSVAGGAAIESQLSLIIPPLAGVEAVAATSGLANPKGFVPVDERYRHPAHPDVYAVGVAVALAPVEETPVPVNFPKTGHMTEQMATIAASDIAARIRCNTVAGESHALAARCIMDMGSRGAYFNVDPVRPPREQIPTLRDGPHWLWAKRAFERIYLWNARHGRAVPTTLGW
jgi:sulfide:quinone oxidoreductase